jgi:uncharacterized protein (TIGR04222 family)
MFPFDLPGPQFLIFYAAFGAAVVAVMHLARRRIEAAPPPPLDPRDPYLLACLRGGPKEVACIATVALIDRGLLELAGKVVSRSANVSPDISRRPIEQAVLRHFERPAELTSVMQQPVVLAVASDDYEFALRHHKLVPDGPMQSTRALLLAGAIAALLAVGGIKLVVALSAGRSNIVFLILMMAAFVLVVRAVGRPYRTTAGDAFLAHVRTMFDGLRDRVSSIRPGSGSRELLWLTSLFGVATLPAEAFPVAQHFRPKKNTNSGGCGASCGSGSGSGGAGGGCGGGGGGCGGCGS